MCTAREIIRFELDMALVQRQLLPANGVMKVALNRPVRILLTEVCNQHSLLPTQMVMGQRCYKLRATLDLNQFLHTLTEA